MKSPDLIEEIARALFAIAYGENEPFDKFAADVEIRFRAYARAALTVILIGQVKFSDKHRKDGMLYRMDHAGIAEFACGASDLAALIERRG